ncbi:hypothetical protein N24_0638 [Corynebacterium suranareeae]|uniref:Uncharacterized protein n=1 Tax=Corynebacterium suranareeae TaxID=2506452 RepID=A0A160PRF7_9CORY|nr:hypothetical protein [Corynebacterium suranareeae]BAU94900.1 hypothetical protein N24_0638 [Corynebacterium suranareeae]
MKNTEPNLHEADTQQWWGFGEASKKPDPDFHIDIDPQWSSLQLSKAVIKANGLRMGVSASLLIVFGMANMLLPSAIGRLVDEVAAPAYSGVDFDQLLKPLML